MGAVCRVDFPSTVQWIYINVNEQQNKMLKKHNIQQNKISKQGNFFNGSLLIRVSWVRLGGRESTWRTNEAINVWDLPPAKSWDGLLSRSLETPEVCGWEVSNEAAEEAMGWRKLTSACASLLSFMLLLMTWDWAAIAFLKVVCLLVSLATAIDPLSIFVLPESIDSAIFWISQSFKNRTVR